MGNILPVYKTDKPGQTCKIKIEGALDVQWSDWLGGLIITQDAQGYSLLTGVVPDQPALHGILIQIRDMGLPFISINP